MAGACFTWQQLQDAAARLVPGLQVWAVISRKLDLQMDASVPQIAAAICCGDDLDVESPLQWDLPSDAAADALSSRRSALLPGLLQLVMCLPRSGRATAALEGLCWMPESDISCSTVAGLLTAALQLSASERVMVLLELPVVRELDAATALQLLQVAVQQRLTFNRFWQLCCLPSLHEEAPSSDSHNAWLQLLSAAIAAELPEHVHALCRLLAVRAAVPDAAAILPLLHSAVQAQGAHMSPRMVGCLLRLPAAAYLSSTDTAAVLEAAQHSGDTMLVQQLEKLLQLQLQGTGALTIELVQSLHI